MILQNGVQQIEGRIDYFHKCYFEIQERMKRVLVGQEHIVKQLTTGLMSGGHMLLIGVPGLAKTLIARVMAETLGWDFQRIQFTPDLMPSDITGTEILQSDETGERRDLIFHKGPIFANLILADEINRTPPKTQAALLEAMQELAVTVSGKRYQLSPPFVVIATQNPIEQEGTYPLPEAQLDRFMLSIHIDYPDQEDELKIARMPSRMKIPDIEPVATLDMFNELIDIVDQVPVSDHVLEYAVRLTAKSRPQNGDEFIKNYVSWGAGPRAAQHLVTVARTTALLDGRPTPEVRDIKNMAMSVLRHRIIPNFNAMGEGIDPEQIVSHLLDTSRESMTV